MSGRTDPPDWLDELYREDGQETPPRQLDERIRAAAHEAVARRATPPWYRQPAKMAVAATLLLAAGVTTLWLGTAGDPEAIPGVTVTSSPAKVTAEVTVAPRRSAETVSSDRAVASVSPPAAPAAADMALSQRQPAPAPPDAALLAQKSAGVAAAVAEERAAVCTDVDGAATEPGRAYQVCRDAAALTVEHPDCADPYQLDAAAEDFSPVGDGLSFSQAGSVMLLRCRDGRWQLTDPTRSEQ